jgi:hypothetical protein
MGASIDTKTALKAFKNSEHYHNLVHIGIGAFEDLLTDGISRKIDANQSNWKALSDRYLKRKTKSGGSKKLWVDTGTVLKR